MSFPFFTKKTPASKAPAIASHAVPQAPAAKVVTTVASVSSRLASDVQKFTRGIVSIKDVIAPSLVEVDFDLIRVNNSYYRTLFVAGYPRFVSANWLSPLLSFDALILW